MPISSERKRPSKPKLRRRFDPKILKRAREIAAGYQVILWFEDGEWYGHGLELPTSYGDGKTPDQCVADTREAFVVTVAYMLKQGQVPPEPALTSERSRRREQVSLRLSREEKLRLEELARQRGFKGVADYLRARALAG